MHNDINIKDLRKVWSVVVKDLLFPMVTIYENPADYKGKFVARIFDRNKPTRVITVKDTLEEVREILPDHLVKIMPSKDDHEAIKEIWI